MHSRIYYRPIPVSHGGTWCLAGGWCGFSTFEKLQRGRPPVIVDTAPDEVLQALTRPRSQLLGLTLDEPRLMGIVNATPDSFSDGGSYDPVEQAENLLASGAEILDIGGESTRPGAVDVDCAEEISRIDPVIRAMRGHVPISIDTRKADVAAAALKAGAGLVNDVSGFDYDPAIPDVVAQNAVPVCLMHAQGVPRTMQDNPSYDDVLLDVYDALEQRIEHARSAGIPLHRIVIDPGIGFGKTQAHNLAIMRRISLYHGLGCPILLGVSRKRFIGTIGGADKADDRMAGTLALTLAAIDQGVQIHRVHDVADIRQGIRLWQAVNKNTEAAQE
ncbi:dihydropteroate synthase [Paracoccus sp. Z330]|uniref:Dihydropteroate synthase n=1 Tax=Paracoccus onchidii TaxID=3017813 RepID=A0ABT4ZCE7_9RHOB|nr:dihydropteroate synthase [Paracoccus onchidii]MDB6177037.1 dihydropteroate synthase [Paracoccus onchidii]